MFWDFIGGTTASGQPVAYFVFEPIIWGLVLGVPVLCWWLWGVWPQFHWVVLLLALGWGLVVWGSFWEPGRLVVREFDIQDETLPPMRLALVSDVHVGPYKGAAWVGKVVEKINGLEDIDMLLMPGDFVFGGAQRYAKELEPLAKLDEKLLRFATLGNHDHDVVEPKNTIQSQAVLGQLWGVGVPPLVNQATEWKEKNIWIVGLDDNDLGYHDWGKALENLPEGAPYILMAHSPDIMLELPERKPLLVVSGHTHCGQIRLPGMGAFPYTIPTKTGKQYENHVYEKDGVHLAITCGVGETGPWSRLFNPPEIMVLNINQPK